MAATSKTTAPDGVLVNQLFATLAEKLKGRDAAIQQRILAHVRLKSGHTTLIKFHNNGATLGEKMDLYRECLQALVKDDWSAIQGEAPSGQVDTPADDFLAKHVVVVPVGGEPEKPAPKPAPVITSYKVGVKTKGDRDWSYNAMRFATADEAERYAKDLFSRWMAMESHEVQPCEDPVTAEWKAGKLVHLDIPEPKPEPEKAPETRQDAPGEAESENRIDETLAPRFVAPAPTPVTQPMRIEVQDNKAQALVELLKGLVGTPEKQWNGELDEGLVHDIAIAEARKLHATWEVAFRAEMTQLIQASVTKAVHDAKFELIKVMEREAKSYRKELAEYLIGD